MSEPAAPSPEVLDQDPAPGRPPTPAEPQVRVGAAIALIAVAVVLALVAVSAVITLRDDGPGSGPAVAPPTGSNDPYAFTIGARTRQLTFDEFRATLPDSPFTCDAPMAPPPAGFHTFVACDAVVQKNYGGSGQDWSANVAVALPEDTLLTRGDLATRAESAFAVMLDGFYRKEQDPEVKQKKRVALTGVAPTGHAYAVYGDVFVSVEGREKKSDRLLVVLLELESGQDILYVTVKPQDANDAIDKAVNASLTSVNAYG